jgi:1-acyl-sn-glycerol-3-phosphate acyltransferase
LAKEATEAATEIQPETGAWSQKAERLASGPRGWLGRFLLWLFGWRTAGRGPSYRKYVVIAAPHTSNWDGLFMILVGFAFGVRFRFLIKDTLFRGPSGLLLRLLGGFPVDRSRRHNLVEQVVESFASHDELVIAVPPEGTRKKVERWKTGFYHMAHAAGVPIAFGFLDYSRKVGGFCGRPLQPTGDIEADFAAIRERYKGVVGKYPAQQMEARATVPVPVAADAA